MSVHRLLGRQGRLRFENDIMCRLGVPVPASRPRPVGGAGIRLALAAFCAMFLIMATAWGFSGFLGMSGRHQDKQALAELTKTLVSALQTGDLRAAMALTVDDENGKRQLEQSSDASPGSVQAAAKGSGKIAESGCQAFLVALREQLAREGVAWDAVRPVGFGGLVASVAAHDGKGRDKAKSILGEVYFASGEKVYALELTARKCSEGYVVMDFWSCKPVPVGAEGLEKYSLGRFQSLGQEPDEKGLPVKVKDLRSVFAPVSTEAASGR